MKVGELIKRLSDLDPGLHVIMPGEDNDFVLVAGAYVDLARLYDGEVQLTDERDPEQSFQVVRLVELEEA